MPIRRDDRGFSPLARRSSPPLGTTTFGVLRDALRHEVGPHYEPDLYIDEDRITVRFISIGVAYSVEHVEGAVERAKRVLPPAYVISVFHPNDAGATK
jgi:hypothetical protein